MVPNNYHTGVFEFWFVEKVIPSWSWITGSEERFRFVFRRRAFFFEIYMGEMSMTSGRFLFKRSGRRNQYLVWVKIM
jgi:hypothetical protein